MINVEILMFAAISLVLGILLGTFSTEDRSEKGLLRFCMTHSIPLEQCKMPEKGDL